MSRSSRILVLGAGGMLGRHVTAVLREEAAAVLESAAPRFSSLADLRLVLARKSPTTVVNCIGYMGQDASQHLLVNAGFPRIIAEYGVQTGALAIQISTNGVFAADDWRCWLPTDATDPRTTYELSKALGEDPRLLVIRASFIGRGPKDTGLFEKLRAGSPYSDRRWNGVTALALARHVGSLIAQWDGVMRSGIEHLYSNRVTSYGELASLLRSKSKQTSEKGFSKLLGGGTAVQDISQQLDEYDRWLNKGGEARLSLDLL